MDSALPTMALSVRQPWAWAIIHAGKSLENRSQIAITRGGMKPGRICIHASKGMTRDGYEYGKRFIENSRSEISFGFAITNVPRPDELVRGAIVGTVTVDRVVRKADNNPWFMGPCALVLQVPTEIEPIPVGGDLGYFQWRPRVGQTFTPKSIEAALPWMLAWPDRHRAVRRVAAAIEPEQDLFPLLHGRADG